MPASPGGTKSPDAGARHEPFPRQIFFAVFLSLALHVLAWELASHYRLIFSDKPELSETKKLDSLDLMLPSPVAFPAKPPHQAVAPASLSAPEAAVQSPQDNAATARPPASMAAPPAPTPEEWAFAARYTLKNSKGYRYSWGQQVRSMMGSAVEGPDQGEVRFRIEIAADGKLAKLETLWTTSAAAERLARKAIESMPALPPTPTGKPLIFEKTISFTAFASNGPPTYKDDCLPDPPAFHNAFAWDGKYPQMHAEPQPAETAEPQTLEECLRQLPQDSIEAEMASDKRQMERW